MDERIDVAPQDDCRRGRGGGLGALLVLSFYLMPGGGVRPDSLFGAAALGPLAVVVTRAVDPLVLLPFVAVFYGVATVLLLRAARSRRASIPAAVAYAAFPFGTGTFVVSEMASPSLGMTAFSTLLWRLDTEVGTLRHLMAHAPAALAAGAVLLTAWHAFAWWCLVRPWFGLNGPLGCFRRRVVGA